MINTEKEIMDLFLRYDFKKLSGKLPVVKRFTSKPIIKHEIYDVFETYNEIYIQLIIKMFRHIGRLKAWNLLLKNNDIEKKLKIEICWDYIEPLLTESSDLPLSFKELIYSSLYKLKLAASEQIDGIIKIKELEKSNKRASYYRDKIKTINIGNEELENKVLDIAEKIYSSELTDLHGKRHHDIFTSICCPVPYSKYSVDNAIISLEFTTLDNRDFEKEISIIEEQSRNTVELYNYWWKYTQSLIEAQYKK